MKLEAKQIRAGKDWAKLEFPMWTSGSGGREITVYPTAQIAIRQTAGIPTGELWVMKGLFYTLSLLELNNENR